MEAPRRVPGTVFFSTKQWPVVRTWMLINRAFGALVVVAARVGHLDTRHRLIRTNHVVFTEGEGGVNETVSRTRDEQDAHTG